MVYEYFNLSDITGVGNESTILTFVEGVNTTMNYVPATLMLIAIYIVLVLALRQFGMMKAIAATSFAMMVLAIITFPMGLISGITLVIFVVLCPLSLFMLWVWGGTEIT